ncbi:MAG: 50S ribosomal protein L3 [Bacillota bacterium]|nr:50S ribosomal protein L3 [Bacillota bacterium]
MHKFIVGKKIGMAQIYSSEGKAVPVTVIEAGPCVVVQKKAQATDGYGALRLGFEAVKPQKLTSPEKGLFEKTKTQPVKVLREARLDDIEGYQVGQEIKCDIFKAGEYVDITGTSRGKGFAGVVKRHGFHRGPMAHGSKYHRGPGSLQSRDAARVFKGRKLPGRMGGTRITVQKLRVVRVDPENNIIIVRGAVPGARGALVTIKDTVKRKYSKA